MSALEPRNWFKMRLFFVIFLVTANSALAINPNELKPCFERYDGFKLVDAVPFHSEWRMKAEEWCLEFCIRASSRCVSIVYDKYSHICHYFSVNGIEAEKINKHPRMVYFQIAEKQCTEKMQARIEQEEYSRQQKFEQQQNLQNEQNSTTETSIQQITNSIPTTEIQNQEEMTARKIELDDSTTQRSNNENLDITSDFQEPTTHEFLTTSINEELTTESFPIQKAEITQGPEVRYPVKTAEIQTKSTNEGEEAEFDGDPMNFVRRFPFEKELPDQVQPVMDPLFPMQEDKIVLPTTTMSSSTMEITTTQPETKTNEETTEPSSTTQQITTTTEKLHPQPVEPSSTTQKSTTTSQQPSTIMPSKTTPEMTTVENVKPSTTKPIIIDPMANFAENAAAILPIMNGFKAVRRPLPTKTELVVEEKKPEMIEVRRSPVKITSDHKLEESKYTGKRPVARKMDSENVEGLEGITADDDETMLADNSPVVDDCTAGMQEIWLAVENSQVNSSIRTTVIKIASQPVECMEACQTLFIGKHPCDSFTFIEPAKRCIFHSSHSGFQVKPSALNDFSTRAFRRFCYAESLTPFSDCAEFLAFRDYTLDMAPREIFENLPLGNEGISACIELCVLSHEFRCKSATFNTINGTCMIFDEHSLSKPSNFKANTDINRLYFENGCIEMKIPESAVQQSKVQRVQPVLLDYRKLTMH